MPDTHGFEVVAEVTAPMLTQVMQAAWKSGGNPGGGGVIPEFFDIPPGTAIGPFVLQDGQVQIPQNELGITMAPDVNGVDLKFGLHIQVHIQNPPVPSASMISMTADCHAKSPVGTLPNSINVAILLDGLPRGSVTAGLTSGDPIEPHLDQYLNEYVHQKYISDGPAFPHTVTQTNQSVTYLGFNAYTVDVFVELFDDANDPAHRIQVTRPPGVVAISIPIHLRIYNIRKNIGLAPSLLDPMGVEARMVLSAALSSNNGVIRAELSNPTVTTEGLTPAAGQEGVNYTANNTTLGGLLPGLISDQLEQQGTTMAQNIGDIVIQVPTTAEIETAIGDAFHLQIEAQGSLAVWTPDNPEGSPVQVNDVTTNAATDFLAIAINAGGGANAAAIGGFVPAGRMFAIGLSAAKVLGIIDQSIHRPEGEGGLGPGFPPKHFDNVNGHEADLTSLNVSLKTGAIHMEGDVTIIDAIAGSIDVDASFEEDVGLHWEDSSNGGQTIKADAGEPDVDLSLLAWIVSFLIGFITLGLVGGVIGLVVMAIVEGIAEKIGGKLVVNNVTNQVEGIGAWPSKLIKIGSVQSRFENPIEINSDGIVLAG